MHTTWILVLLLSLQPNNIHGHNNDATLSKDDVTGYCRSEEDCDVSTAAIDTLNEHQLIDRLQQKAALYPTKLDDLKELIDIKDRIVALQSDQEDYLPKRKSLEDAVEKLNSWAAEELGVSGVKGQVDEPFGLGLVATKDFKKNDIIMNIHVKNTFATQHTKDRFACLGNIEDEIKQRHDFWPIVNLTLDILAEAYKPNSRYRPYMNALPSTFTNPIYFNYDDIVALKNSFLFNISIRKLCDAFVIYAAVWKRFTERPDCAIQLGISPERLTFKAFQWAYTTTRTRDYEGHFNQGEENTVVIPFWDLANHDPEGALMIKNVATGAKSDRSNGAYATYARRAIKKGETVNLPYTSSVRAYQAFAVWGFVSVTTYDLLIRLDKADPNYENMFNELNRTNTWRNGVRLGHPDYLNGFPLTDYHDFEAMRTLLRIATGNAKAEYTPKTVRKAWTFLADQIDRRIAEYETTVDGFAELRDKAPSGNLQMIYTQLADELHLLEKIQDYVSGILED